MAQENAKHAFSEKRREGDDVQERPEQLQRAPPPPDGAGKRIECCDISHLGGGDTVGAIVAMKDGVPDKKHTPARSTWKSGKGAGAEARGRLRRDVRSARAAFPAGAHGEGRARRGRRGRAGRGRGTGERGPAVVHAALGATAGGALAVGGRAVRARLSARKGGAGARVRFDLGATGSLRGRPPGGEGAAQRRARRGARSRPPRDADRGAREGEGEHPGRDAGGSRVPAGPEEPDQPQEPLRVALLSRPRAGQKRTASRTERGSASARRAGCVRRSTTSPGIGPSKTKTALLKTLGTVAAVKRATDRGAPRGAGGHGAARGGAAEGVSEGSDRHGGSDSGGRPRSRGRSPRR